MPAEWSEVEEWLSKAREDLLSARILLGHDPPVLSTACFHCQQAVEKALKAFLVSRGVAFERVHSLPYLLDLCDEAGLDIAEQRDGVEALGPFAVGLRYPGEPCDIDAKTAQSSLTTAEVVWSLLRDLIPGDRPS